MTSNRLEAFSDGVFAIVITIMVLELRAPHSTDISALRPLVPVFLSYVLSFVFVGIYWNNHHHMLHAVQHITGQNLWANLHLLFWLSLIPFVTAWMGENHFAPLPVALYGIVLLFSAIAYSLLQLSLVRSEGRNSVLARALGSDRKGKLSMALYAVAVAIAAFYPRVAGCVYVFVAILWLIPDTRIERTLDNSRH